MSSVKTKAVFLDAYTLDPGDNSLDVLHEILDLSVYSNTSPSDIVKRAKDAEILIVNKLGITASTIQELQNLKLIQVAATGYNNVDIKIARNSGIDVCNVSGYSNSSVVQHVFAMLLAYMNNPERYFAESKKATWANKEHFSYWQNPILELSGKTMGIFGYGKIGEAVARVALAFGMKVLVTSRTPKEVNNVQWVDTETLFSSSDFISLHAPLTEETNNLINSRTLEMMSDHAVLINTARGALINESELAYALKNKKIKAALLDVLCQEPPEKENVLFSAPNCYITPHQAWASLESRQRLVQLMYKNLSQWLQGMPIETVN